MHGLQRSVCLIFTCFLACGTAPVDATDSEDSGSGFDASFDSSKDSSKSDVAKSDTFTGDGSGSGDGASGEISDSGSEIVGSDAIVDSGSDTGSTDEDSAPEISGPVCGDGKCNFPETNGNCSSDCPAPVCGDGFCQKPESGVVCELDCDPKTLGAVACIKKVCAADLATCSSDKECAKILGSGLSCVNSTSGDTDFCLKTLASNAKGKGLTAPACNAGSCATGSPASPVCGDGTCASGETASSCGYDCFGGK